jgi:hypothetical protein
MGFCPQCGVKQPGPEPGAVSYRSLFFTRTILGKFGDGAFFRRFFSIFLYILGGIWCLGGLAGAIFMADGYLREAVGGFVAYIVFLPVMLAGLYMAVHATFIRAGHVARLSGGAYAVVPIFSVLLKLAGELGAIIVLVMGVTGGLTAWFGAGATDGLAQSPAFLHWLLAGRGFGAGLLGMVGGCVSAVAWLTVFYFLAEQIVALVDVASGIKTMADGVKTRAGDR